MCEKEAVADPGVFPWFPLNPPFSFSLIIHNVAQL